ncbi:hypothetical protein ACJJTC_005863 [Scirpophaga incertulas]
MKTSVFLVLGFAAIAATRQVEDSIAENLSIKQRQIFILKLLNNINEPVMYKDIEDIGRNFNIEENINLYTRQEVVKSFINHLKFGTLPRGEIFTLHVDRQLKEVVTMFHMLYYAKDYESFIKTACWMRLYLNEGMFAYALTVAVRHREDCKGIILPPPYEIYPFYFVRADVIQKAYLLKMKRGILDHKLCEFYGIKKTENNVLIIDENVYDNRVALNKEHKLTYFTEDIDLNTYNYYFHVDYPFWMKDEVSNKLRTRRYELTLYYYQQILARYNLERLSNGLDVVQTLSFEKPIRHGYYPWIMLHNGVQIPARFNNYVAVHEDNIENIRLVEGYEQIIKDAIIKGYVDINGVRYELMKQDDVEILGKLIYGKIDKVPVDNIHYDAYRYLLIILKSVLGLNTLKSDKYFVAPTVLDQYQTALRDPVFYTLQKRLVDLVYLYKLRLPSYSKDDLYYPGIKIDNVVTDKLVTYFDDYLMDITNAVILTEDEYKKTTPDLKFLVRKRRLNNQPFKVTIDILSDKTADAVVRIFLGPKEDYLGQLIDINKNRINFVEIDSFLYKLQNGKNTLVRNSYDMQNLVRDRVMTHDLWKKVNTINAFNDLFRKDLRNYHTGFPARLLLPKGYVGGMNLYLYVIVTPLKLVDNVDVNILDTNRRDVFSESRYTTLLDKRPLGFPFDRRIDITKFYTPNMKFVDVTVYHKTQVCDMKTRWERYVLRDYNLVDRTTFDDTYFTDTDINFKAVDGSKVVDL